ncbi:hypothetical protein WJ63_36895 [Burkholderia pyrrocinia]|nr:hypothetical protein WJ63_36895 [Burkholderia pyrrocinia]
MSAIKLCTHSSGGSVQHIAKTARETQIDFVSYMHTGMYIATTAASGLQFKRPEDLCDRKRTQRPASIGTAKAPGQRLLWRTTEETQRLQTPVM